MHMLFLLLRSVLIHLPMNQHLRKVRTSSRLAAKASAASPSPEVCDLTGEDDGHLDMSANVLQDFFDEPEASGSDGEGDDEGDEGDEGDEEEGDEAVGVEDEEEDLEEGVNHAVSSGSFTVYGDTVVLELLDKPVPHVTTFLQIARVKSSTDPSKDLQHKVSSGDLCTLADHARGHLNGNNVVVKVLLHMRIRQSNKLDRSGAWVLGPTNSQKQFRTIVQCFGKMELVSTSHLRRFNIDLPGWLATVRSVHGMSVTDAFHASVCVCV